MNVCRPVALRSATISCLCIILVSCASYGPSGNGRMYGYRDRKIEDGVYFIAYSSPANDKQNALYWHRRAAELCGGAEHYNIIDEYPTLGRNIIDVENLQDKDITELNLSGTPSGDSLDTAKKKEVYEWNGIIEGYIRCHR